MSATAHEILPPSSVGMKPPKSVIVPSVAAPQILQNGIGIGALVGDSVGSIVGTAVGTGVGNNVGNSVGEFVGFSAFVRFGLMEHENERNERRDRTTS